MRRFRCLFMTCLCGAILPAFSPGRAIAEASADRLILAKAAENTLKDIDETAIQNKRAKFDSRLDRARELLKRRQYPNALVAVDEALKLYPADKAAQYLKDKILVDSNKTREALRRAALESATDRAMQAIDEELILPDTRNVVSRPAVESWGDVIRRSKSLGTGVKVENWETRLKKALDERISFEFKSVTLSRVTQYLQNSTNVGIVIDPQAPIGKTPITLAARNITLASALSHICRFADVKWSMADTMIYISDSEVTDRPELATYTVTDLITPVRDFAANDRPSPIGATNRALRERYNGVQMSVEYAPRKATGKEEYNNGWSLARFIANNIARGSWSGKDEAGGAAANTIQYRSGKLVVSAPVAIQDQILKLLESFRKARAVQIMVQARFIDIDKNYLEEVGVDWTGLQGGVNTISTSS
ncbi:MAG: hypothetical protein HQ592_00040, partial [Planctomycetes bacterium]|nr:hypothetical protein [Planctomycetota bacterium]